MTFHTLRQDTESHAMFMASGDPLKAAFFTQDAIVIACEGGRHFATAIFMAGMGGDAQREQQFSDAELEAILPARSGARSSSLTTKLIWRKGNKLRSASPTSLTLAASKRRIIPNILAKSRRKPLSRFQSISHDPLGIGIKRGENHDDIKQGQRLQPPPLSESGRSGRRRDGRRADHRQCAGADQHALAEHLAGQGYLPRIRARLRQEG
jgi:hypothetical protein